MVKERRDEKQIVGKMLQIANKSARKTELVYGVNINFALVKAYLNKMEYNGLIEHHYGMEGRRLVGTYHITEKGKRFIELETEIEELWK